MLSEKQKIVFKGSNSRINIATGGVRSGKTYVYNLRWLKHIRQNPNGELMMVGKTVKALERNILRPMQEMFGDRLVSYSLGNKTALIAGRRINIEGANDERAEQKIRGMTLAGAYLDEISLYPQSFFKQILTRCSVKGAKIFATTNPDSPYHWLKTDYIDRKDELNLSVFNFILYDNTFLDSEYILSLESELSGVWRRRMVDGEWAMAEGVIYDMWDEKKYVSADWVSNGEWWAGVDYGTTNPFSISLFTIDQKTGKRVLADELYYDSSERGVQRTDSQYAEMLRDFVPQDAVVYIDPSAASFILECVNRGIYALHANNAVLDGIRFVASSLSKSDLIIDPKCTNHIRQFSSYSWDEKSQKLGIDKPLKMNDHAMDSFRYGHVTHQTTSPFYFAS